MTQRNVANYEIHKRLGKGGMGVVYQATDLRLGRTVALKFLPSELADSEQDRQRFTREAMAASSLDHPNICTIHEIGTTEEGELFIAMASYEGQTLRGLLKGGAQPLDRAIELTRQIAEGLSKAHRHDVIHRDVKPGNLFLTEDGVVKILDFGLARMGLKSDLTATGQVVGTFKYMAPEQIRGGQVDHRVDIWSLGVVLYELVTGQRPFEGDVAQIAYAVTTRDPEPVRRLRPEAPASLADIVGKAMARAVEHRYQNIDQMLADLKLCREAIVVADDDTFFEGPNFVRPSINETVSIQSRDLQLSGRSRQDASGVDTGQQEETSIKSLAVLPFEDLGGDPENVHFVDGLTDDLIHAVSVHKQLRVISRNSVHQFRNQRAELSEIRELLGVDAVIEGTIRQSGNRIRVVARLVNAANGEQIWSEKYDREVGDVFALQDEIAGKIHQRLELELESQTGQMQRAVYDGDMEVYELYLKGRYFWHQGMMPESMECYEKAIRHDSEFALAHAGLANVHAKLGLYGGVIPTEVWPMVRASVLRALELNHNLPEAHQALGFLRTFADWDWKAAGRAFREAVRLDPGNADPLVSLAIYYLQLARFDEAERQLELARKQDPLSPVILGSGIVRLVYSRKFDLAIEAANSALQIAETFDILLFRAMAMQGVGDYENAIVEFNKLYEMTGHGPIIGGFLGACYGAAGQHEKAREILAAAQPTEQMPYIPPTVSAMILGAMGELDEAFSNLEAAADVRDPGLCYARVMPAFDPFRDDPRFDSILERIGLGDEALDNHASAT